MPVRLTAGHLKYMNLGKRYYGASVSSFKSSQSESIESYLSKISLYIKQGVGLYLWGPNSVGKSYVAAALCKYVWSEYRVTSYCTVAAELKDAWASTDFVPAHEDSKESMAERVEEVRFLVIDDVGKEHRTNSGFFESALGKLLRYRSRGRKVTILTSNLSMEAFTKIYRESTSRLVQECTVEVKLVGPDLREKVRQSIQKSLA